MIQSDPTCWVCESRGLTLERPSGITKKIDSQDFAITDSHYGVTGALLVCSKCGFLQCNDFGELLRYYETLEDHAYEEGRDQRAVHARRLLEIVSRHVPRGRLVDIGAGTGILVEEALASGYEAEGVEPSRWLHQRSIERGLKVHLGTYPHRDVQPDFKVVTLIDVIEHVSNPVELLRHVASGLADNGVGLVVTPDVNSIAARLMGPKWWHFRIAHIGYFNRHNLTLALAQAGLEPVEVGRPSWYFSAAYLVERVNHYLPQSLHLPTIATMRKLTVRLNLRDSLYVIFRKQFAS